MKVLEEMNTIIARLQKKSIRIPILPIYLLQQIDPCDYFRVQTESFSRNAWRGHLVLIKQLDFENTPSFRVPLQASVSTSTVYLTSPFRVPLYRHR